MRVALVILAGLLFGAALPAAPAHAQTLRTWVSGVGDDLNPCARTAPCKTFAGAISKTAAGGEIDCLDAGGFGAVTIVKSITIDCEGAFGAISAAGTNGVIVNGAGVVVKLRNFSISGNGSGLNGIRFLQGAALHVENLRIYDFTQKAIDFEPSTAAALFVGNTRIENNTLSAAAGGIFIKPAAGIAVTASLSNVRLERNTFGLRVEGGSDVGISDSVVAGNANGIQLVSGVASEIVVSNVKVLHNTANGLQASGVNATIRVGGSVISGNGAGIAGGTTGKVLSLGDNLISGNATDGAPTGSIAPK